MTPSHADLMLAALSVARRALLTDDIPVGAIVLDPSGNELASACNAREALGDPTAHAEILALRAAAARHGDGWRLTNCTLVVTVEPCTMCGGAAVLSRISTLIYGTPQPRTGAAGSLWDVVRDRRLPHRPEVVPNILAPTCAALLDDFFTTHR